MTPKHFTALGIVAALCLSAAIGSYATSISWSSGTAVGAPLFENMRKTPPEIARIEIEQGGNKLTLERSGKDWLLNERDRFPAKTEKVRTLLQSMAEADLVEKKTRKADRYALLGLDDPKNSGAKSRLVRLFDAQGKSLAQAIVGSRRIDAFGSGKGGTYVRLPGEQQSWLTDTVIEAGTELRDWVDPQIVLAGLPQIKNVSLNSPGKEKVEIERGSDRAHVLRDIPEGMKIRYVNSIDDMLDAVASYQFDDVRRRTLSAAPDKVSTAVINLDSGVEVTVSMERQDGSAWVSFDAKGEGDAKAAADALMARVKDWEFRVPASKIGAVFKSRDELLEKIAS
jgi:hypothetical protein